MTSLEEVISFAFSLVIASEELTLSIVSLDIFSELKLLLLSSILSDKSVAFVCAFTFVSLFVSDICVELNSVSSSTSFFKGCSCSLG